MGRTKPIDAAAFRTRLEAMRAELTSLAEGARETGSTVELDQTRVGRLSRMDALQGHAMDQATERRRQQSIQRIDAALKRIEDGEFGECVTCGGAIAPARLEADPTVAVCIKCAR
jgi:DnaK suppressor protein